MEKSFFLVACFKGHLTQAATLHPLAAIATHGRANQQLVISHVVPPTWPHHSDISWRRGLRWLTPSGSFTRTDPSSKKSDEASMATCYVVRTPAASSSLALFSNHGRGRPQLSEQRAVFVFFRRPFYFRRVPPCACAGLWCITQRRLPRPPRSLIYPGPSTKACREEGRGEEYKGEERCFLSSSITNIPFTIVFGRELFHLARLWSELISWRDNELFNCSAQSGPDVGHS